VLTEPNIVLTEPNIVLTEPNIVLTEPIDLSYSIYEPLGDDINNNHL
jgi:hypothetical protein